MIRAGARLKAQGENNLFLHRFHAGALVGYISFCKSVIPAWIHAGLSGPAPFGSMQIRSQRICAGIQATWTYLRLPFMALDTRFPAGMTGYLKCVYNDERWSEGYMRFCLAPLTSCLYKI